MHLSGATMIQEMHRFDSNIARRKRHSAFLHGQGQSRLNPLQRRRVSFTCLPTSANPIEFEIFSPK
jgi:hypothetical protein